MSLLNQLRAPRGARKNKKRLGRGESSGLGKTSGRGHKGQRARAGGYHKVGFEGGQMPLQRRLPKRGFTSRNKKQYAIVNVSQLQNLAAHTEVNAEFLKSQGIVSKIGDGIKILGDGEIKVALKITATRFTKQAIEKIEKAGGQAIALGKGS